MGKGHFRCDNDQVTRLRVTSDYEAYDTQNRWSSSSSRRCCCNHHESTTSPLSLRDKSLDREKSKYVAAGDTKELSAERHETTPARSFNSEAERQRRGLLGNGYFSLGKMIDIWHLSRAFYVTDITSGQSHSSIYLLMLTVVDLLLI